MGAPYKGVDEEETLRGMSKMQISRQGRSINGWVIQMGRKE